MTPPSFDDELLPADPAVYRVIMALDECWSCQRIAECVEDFRPGVGKVLVCGVCKKLGEATQAPPPWDDEEGSSYR